MPKTTKFKRMLSTLLCGAMLMGSLTPFAVPAAAATSATASGTAASNGVALDYEKHIRDNGDGTYTLTLSAKTKISYTALNTDTYTAEKGYYEVPADGKYIIQAWGSNGGKGADVNTSILGTNVKEGGAGGAGGYVEGVVTLKAGQVIAYDIGSNGSTNTGGVNGNGGDKGDYGSFSVGGGGGYTAVFVYDSVDEVDYDHASDYVLIAGGGGGGGAGHSSQSKTPDGGDAGNIKTSAYAELTEAQNNGVAGTYYAGSNGHSNSDDDSYVGYGATNVPGAANSSILSFISSESGNDWLATYDPSRAGGAGGSGNGRGGAGGAGFAGGSGGIQNNILAAWDCGGGGGGSSFVAASAEPVEDAYRTYMAEENTSTTGGSVVIIPIIENVENISTLSSTTITGTISEYFVIDKIAPEGTVSGNTFTFNGVDLEPGMTTDSAVASVSVVIKPVDGFAGGNYVPVLDGVMTVFAGETYSYTIPANEDTDYVNVPWSETITAYTYYADPETDTTVSFADLFLDESAALQALIADSDFIASVSKYTVTGPNNTVMTDGFAVPEETTKYIVSYTVTAKNSDVAKVGTPVNGTVSATAIVDVSGMQYVSVDGANNGYKKTLKYNSDTNTYDLIITHTVSAVEGVGSDVTYTDEIEEVATYTDAGSFTYTFDQDGYYLILLRGADGGDGGDTCGDKYELLGSGGGHRHGYGGAGAAGGYAYMLGNFAANDVLDLIIGANGTDQSLVSAKTQVFAENEAVGLAGTAGGYTSVSLWGTYLAVAGGGAGGGGSYALNGNTDYWGHGYAATQSEAPTISEMITVSNSTNGTDGSQSGRGTDQDYMAFAAGTSGTSYIHKDYSVDDFEFADSYYEEIKDTDKFKALIGLVNVDAETARDHSCDGEDANGIQPDSAPAESLKKAHVELTNLKDTAGIKIYKITRTKTETEFPGVRENLNLSGTISEYFTIKSVSAAVNGETVDSTDTYFTTAYTNGDVEETSTFSVSNISAETTDVITYTISLTPKDGFLGGNNVPVLEKASFSREGVTSEDKTDDTGALEPKDASDYANVAIAATGVSVTAKDATIVKGESVAVADLVDTVYTLPGDWTDDYVECYVTLTDANGNVYSKSVSPTVTTDYDVTVTVAPKDDGDKAVVAQPAESVIAKDTATVTVEYTVDYKGENITGSNETNAQYHESYSTTLLADGYALPDTITVTMGDDELIAGTDYTYNSTTGEVVILAGVIEDNIVITADATEKTYDIVYRAYGADGSLVETWTESFTIGETITTTAADAYKETADASADLGYEFVWEWATDDGKQPDVMPASNIVVNGSYQKKAYTLTINYVYADKTEAAETVTQSVLYSDSYSVDSPVIKGYVADKVTVSGTMPVANVTVTVTYTETEKYQLIIYYVYKDGGTAADTYSALLEEGNTYFVTSPTITWYEADPETVSGTMGTAAVTVTVTYTENVPEVTVTFNAQGGTLADGEDEKTVQCGNNHVYGTLPTPVKSGATFLGWFTAAENGTQVVSTTVVTNDREHTLYAHWKAITENVTYDANGGTFADGTTTKVVTGTYGEAYPTVDEKPTRSGYEFTGWYLDAAASTALTTDHTFTATSARTIYAGWKLVDSATVKFMDGDVVVAQHTYDVAESYTGKVPTAPTAGGYFKGWVGDTETLTFDYTKTAQKQGNLEYTVKDTNDSTATFTATYNAQWYDESAMGTTCISNAKAQAVTLKSGDKAIRFLALIDGDYADYSKAGFIITTECPTPTIEAGYKYSVQTKIYKKVYAMKADGETGWLDIAYLSENTFSFASGAGLLYTNLVITDESQVYYATPYIVKDTGERVYGKARAISYNELLQLDAEAAAKAQ